MANTYHQLYVQTVFAVSSNTALLNQEWRSSVFAVIGNLINESGGKTLIVNGVEDHVHCLLQLKPVTSIANLLKAVKAKSSKYINERKLTSGKFSWQDGYGAFTYSSSQIDHVFRYIANQEQHHKRIGFRDEYISLLNEFGITFDEKYIFFDPR